MSSKISALVTEYFAQLDHVEYCRLERERADGIFKAQYRKMEGIEAQLKGNVTTERPRLLVQDGSRFVLIRKTKYGADIEVLDLVP